MRVKRLKQILKNFGLLWQALKKFNDDNGFFLSAGIAFNLLINLIPFILLLLALVGTVLYNDQEVLNYIHAYFRDVAPALDPKVTSNLMDVVQNRQIVGILGFVGLLWFSTWVFSSLRIAFNIVFRIEKSRRMLRGIAVDLLMILLVGILLLVSMTLSSVGAFLPGYQGPIPVAIGPPIQWILKYLLPFSLTTSFYLGGCIILQRFSSWELSWPISWRKIDKLPRSKERRVFPVNPHVGKVLDAESYPTIAGVPEQVDLAVMATPAQSGPGVVEECGRGS